MITANEVLNLLSENSNPAQYESPKKFSHTELVSAIRQDIMAEYDAVSLYEAHKSATDNKEVMDLLDHIIGEEKQHIKELEELLTKIEKE